MTPRYAPPTASQPDRAHVYDQNGKIVATLRLNQPLRSYQDPDRVEFAERVRILCERWSERVTTPAAGSRT